MSEVPTAGEPYSNAPVATLSSLATTVGAVAFALLRSLPNPRNVTATPFLSPETLVTVATVSLVTWIVVRLRFPFTMMFGAIAFAYWPSESSASDAGAFAIIVFSQNLLARSRFFAADGTTFSQRFAATCSGWLTALSLLLILIANDQVHLHPRPWYVPSLPAIAALVFGVLAVVRRAPSAARATLPPRGSVGLAFAAGFACLLAGILTLVATAAVFDLVAPTGGSSAPNAWQLSTEPAYDN